MPFFDNVEINSETKGHRQNNYIFINNNHWLSTGTLYMYVDTDVELTTKGCILIKKKKKDKTNNFNEFLREGKDPFAPY